MKIDEKERTFKMSVWLRGDERTATPSFVLFVYALCPRDIFVQVRKDQYVVRETSDGVSMMPLHGITQIKVEEIAELPEDQTCHHN